MADRAASPPPQYVKFTFFRIDPAWRRIEPLRKSEDKEEFAAVVAKFEDSLILRTYSTVGTRGDCDFFLWTVGSNLDEIQAFHAALNQTRLAGYLSTPHSFLSVTRRSQYVKAHQREDPAGHGGMRTIVPGNGKYLFVYPFWKTAEWYQLPMEKRQELMNEHFRIGHRFPDLTIHTTYAFGLDDPEFVLGFEGDNPDSFVECVVQLREAKQRPYTLRDTPIFTGARETIQSALAKLG